MEEIEDNRFKKFHLKMLKSTFYYALPALTIIIAMFCTFFGIYSNRGLNMMIWIGGNISIILLIIKGLYAICDFPLGNNQITFMKYVTYVLLCIIVLLLFKVIGTLLVSNNKSPAIFLILLTKLSPIHLFLHRLVDGVAIKYRELIFLISIIIIFSCFFFDDLEFSEKLHIYMHYLNAILSTISILTLIERKKLSDNKKNTKDFAIFEIVLLCIFVFVLFNISVDDIFYKIKDLKAFKWRKNLIIVDVFEGIKKYNRDNEALLSRVPEEMLFESRQMTTRFFDRVQNFNK